MSQSNSAQSCGYSLALIGTEAGDGEDTSLRGIAAVGIKARPGGRGGTEGRGGKQRITAVAGKEPVCGCLQFSSYLRELQACTANSHTYCKASQAGSYWHPPDRDRLRNGMEF